ncbi:MAG TPA: hypothetical protein VFB80_08535 [Pirellulaceae bacterium]|nr:hypothetical protein [Pirellulaceae bacterium]
MSAVRLIVCEGQGRWAAALRASLGGDASLIAETRSLSQCEQALSAAPASVVAVEAAADNAQAVIAFFLRAARFPQARLAALVAAEFADAEPLLREAGALDVLSTVADAPRLAQLALRQKKLQPEEPQSLEEFIGQRLPWPAHASDPA